MYSEPVFTDGLENSVQWTDESLSGAVEYEVVAALDANFDTIQDGSGWTAGTNWTFTALPDSATIWYHVHSRDIKGVVSRWSPSVFSTQDNSPPESEATGPAGPIAGLPFTLEYVASDGASGVAEVELWYSFDGGDYVYYGTNNEGSFNFTIPDGGGTYGFYTIATDQLGHIEDIPIEADLVVEVGGSGTIAQSVRAVAFDGCISMIGVLTGISGEVPTAELFQKNARIHGITVGSQQHQADMIAAIEANDIHPVIDSRFELAKLADAFRLQESQQHFGKICVEI
ncbi:MAG: zinc-binding dehydrogenase [Halieaceae bacterium]|nr:zinc-binding dehydrogenase [Halieaceae bacterium]